MARSNSDEAHLLEEAIKAFNPEGDTHTFSMVMSRCDMIWLHKQDAHILLDAIQYCLGAMPDNKEKRISELLEHIIDNIENYTY